MSVQNQPRLPLTDKKGVLFVFAIAFCFRLTLLYFLHDSAAFTPAMAQGDAAYGLVSGEGLVHYALPGCGIGPVQNRRGRLINVDDYLQHYRDWCPGIDIPATVSDHPEPFISYMMPGPSILLAGTYLIFHHHKYIYLQVVQAIVDSLGVLLLWAIGHSFFDRSSSLIAICAFALFLPEAKLAIAGGIRDAWMPFLCLAILYCFLHGYREERTRWFMLTGLAVGATCYFRPNMLLFPLAATAFLSVVRAQSWTIRLARLAAMTVPIIVLLLPWWIRNEHIFGRFIPTNAGAWMATWEGFGEVRNSFGAVKDDSATYAQYRRAGGTASYVSLRYADDYFRPKVLEVIRAHPFWYISLICRRAWQVVWPPHANQSLPRRTYTYYLLLHLLLFSSAIIGIIIRHARVCDNVMVLSVFLYYTATFLPAVYSSHYFLPGNTALFLFSATTLTRVSRRLLSSVHKNAHEDPARMSVDASETVA